MSGNNVTASTEGVGLLKGSNTFTNNTFNIDASGNAMVLYGSASHTELTASGNTVNVGGGGLQNAAYLAGDNGALNLADGNYTLGSTLYISNDGLTVTGESEGGTLIDGSGTGGYGIYVSADDATLKKFTLQGPTANSYGIHVSPGGAASSRLTNFSIQNVTIQGSGRTELDLNGVNGATIDNVTADGQGTGGNGISLTDSANITVTNTTTTDNTWGGLALYQANNYYDQQVDNITIDGTNSFGNGIYAQDQSATNDFGSIDLTGQGIQYVAKIATGGSDGDYTFFSTTEQGAVDSAVYLNTRYTLNTGNVQGYAGTSVDGDGTYYVGVATGGTAMSITGTQSVSSTGDTINVGSGTYNEDVTVNDARTFLFDNATINSFTQNVASAIGGVVSAVNGFIFGSSTTLADDTTLNGAVTAAAIDGSSAGGQSLTIAGTGKIVSLGNLGATTRLGLTSVTGNTSLTGNSFAANGLTFTGPVTLTRSLTTFNTTISASSAGDITFNGDLFGTADSAQSVSFIAGPGTGAASANGDITLQNAGTNAIWLGSMTATGNDLTGKTVYVGGNYKATLTGDQFFYTDTLHTRGSVDSTVGGNATGPIISDGNVNVSAGGDFSGDVNAPTGSVSGNNVSGNFTGNSFQITGNSSVNVNVDVNTLDVNSPSGSVNGTFSTISTSGSGPLTVNGKTRTGDSGPNENQLVVEGYTLPEGAFVTDTGEIILPSGLQLGLISPQAGPGSEPVKPKVILVHNVRTLGELLSQGYTVIVIDLSKDGENQEIASAD